MTMAIPLSTVNTMWTLPSTIPALSILPCLSLIWVILKHKHQTQNSGKGEEMVEKTMITLP